MLVTDVLAAALVVICALALALRFGFAAGAARAAAKRAALVGAIAATASLTALSCGREVTAPRDGALRVVHGFSFATIFPSLLSQIDGGAASIVAFTRVHVLLKHPDGSVACDTVVDFSSGGPDEMTLSLKVTLLQRTVSSGETMTLELDYVNASGETVFRGGPMPILVMPNHAGDPAPLPVTIVVHYSGTGSNAASVRIAPRTLALTAGDAFTLTATAFDPSGAAIANTPIVWSALDPTIASLTAASAGAGTAHVTRGTARITTQLLTGPADTVTLTVLPKIGALAVASGNDQVGIAGTMLAQPVAVRATATDGLPMAGVTVTFSASAGAAVADATVTTNAAGVAQTTWRLAPTPGAQSMTATAAALAGVVVTFNATSNPGPAAQLVMATQPAAVATAGAPLTPVVVTAQDTFGNTAVGFTGAVTMALGANPGGSALVGTTTVNAVAGVATFSNLRIRQVGTGYTLAATSASFATITSSAFAVNAAPAAELSLVSGDGQTDLVGATLVRPIVVLVTDSLGNPVADKNVTFAVATGGGSLSAGTVATAANGRAATNWTLGPLVGVQTLSVSGTGLAPSSLTVQANATHVAQLQFVQQPTNTTAGVAMTPSVTVRALNASGATDPTFTGTVTLTLGTNPANATLGGTTTAVASNGMAIFTGIRIRKATTGYRLLASASGWDSDLSSLFNIVASGAKFAAISSGNAQSGATSAALANPLVVLVTDSTGNPVSGATVSWAVASGSVSPTSGTTNASGLASTAWTLGANGGAQTATATVGAIWPVTFTATATAPPATYSKTWTGATSTAWGDASNWSPVGVPSTSDSTLIPAVTNQPALGALASIGKLTIASGAVLSLGSFELDIFNNLNNTGAISGTAGSVVWFQAWSPAPSLSFNGTITAQTIMISGSTGIVTSLSGDATLTGAVSGGLLSPNGHALTVNGTLTVFLNMTNAADSVNVSGKVTMNAGDEGGRLTAGTLVVGGDFQQSGSYQTFKATGTHKVVMKGSAAQHIAMYTVINRYSHFNDLVIDNAAGVVTDSVNYDNGSGSYYGGLTEVARNLTILNGTLSGARGSYVIVGGTLTDAVGGRVTVPKLYFDSSSTPVSGSTPTISVPNLYFSAAATTPLQGDLTINGNTNLTGTDTLKLNGHALTINGDLTAPSCCSGTGMLDLTNSADVLTVSGAISLAGSSAGTFTAGTIYAGGNFQMGGAFKASGSNKVVLRGSGTSYLNLSGGDSTSTGSHFNDLEVANTAADTIVISGGGTFVNGTFTKTTAAATVLRYSATAVEKLYAAGVNVTQPITFDRVQFWLVPGGPMTAFDNASFVNSWYYPAEDPAVSGTQQFHLNVVRSDAATFTFSGLSFSNLTPQYPGPSPRSNPWGYVRVLGSASLTVSLTGTTPSLASLPAGKTLVTGGATLTWAP